MSSIHRAFLVALPAGLCALLALACSKPNSEPAPSTSSSTTGAPALPSGTPTDQNQATNVDPKTAPPPPSAGMSMGEIFGSEANRPAGAIKTEDVVDAFTKAGATVRDQKQHLGSSFKARYCMGVKTGEDIHISICEYDNEKIAEEGKETSAKLFAKVPNRTLHRNGQTTLTMRLGQNTPADQVLAKKLVEAFNGLKSPPPAPAPKK